MSSGRIRRRTVIRSPSRTNRDGRVRVEAPGGREDAVGLPFQIEDVRVVEKIPVAVHVEHAPVAVRVRRRVGDPHPCGRPVVSHAVPSLSGPVVGAVARRVPVMLHDAGPWDENTGAPP